MGETMDIETTSTRPYLIRAIHEWCCDNGYTPHITVSVDNSVQVPREYVKDGEILLNVGLTATTGLQLGNDYISFKARFAGVARDIMVPVDQVVAIFARENGQGMAFPQISKPDTAPEPQKPAARTRPALTRIK
jgi:stringent starvation protein B